MNRLGRFTSKPNDHRDWPFRRLIPRSLYSLRSAHSRKHWAPEAGSPSCPHLTDAEAEAWEEIHLPNHPTKSAGKLGLSPGLLEPDDQHRLPAGPSAGVGSGGGWTASKVVHSGKFCLSSHLGSPGWPGTHRDPPASALPIPRIKGMCHHTQLEGFLLVSTQRTRTLLL